MERIGEASDEELVARAAREGRQDPRPFTELVRRHRGFVAANCRTITRSPGDVDDLAQEIFVKAFFGLRGFEGRSQFRTWLGRIKVNHCLNYLRKQRGAVMVDVETASEAGHDALQTPPNATAAFAASEQRNRIVEILDGMPDTLRIPLVLRDGDGHSYQDIADELGLSLSAVKMRIKRGREEFRRRYALQGVPQDGVPA